MYRYTPSTVLKVMKLNMYVKHVMHICTFNFSVNERNMSEVLSITYRNGDMFCYIALDYTCKKMTEVMEGSIHPLGPYSVQSVGAA